MTIPLRIALIGAGGIGATHAQVAAASPGLAFVAVCDSDAARAQAVSRRYGVAAFESVEALCERGDVQAAIVATPPNTHAGIAVTLLRRGLHVLCEKPFAPSVSDAKAMIAAARRSKTILGMASKFRFAEDLCEARRLLQRGTIGDTLMIENTFTSSVVMGGRWNSNPAVSGGGVIIDNGTHAVDIFRFLGGPICDIRAAEYRRYQRLAVEDTAVVFGRLESGAVVTSDLSWSIDKHSEHYVRVHGTHGTVEVGWHGSRLRTDEGGWQSFGSGYSKARSFGKMLENFVRAAQGKEPLAVPAEDALASVMAIEQAYRSLRGRVRASA